MSKTSSPARGIGSAIDLGVAGIAAASVAFLTFAMPDDLFSSLVAASHLPDVVAAAAPPLGEKARYAAMAGAGLVVFLAVWALMRALDAKPAPAARPAQESEIDAPRLRRADAHPDAPARRPLFAGADLGEPEHDIYELDSLDALDEPEPAPFRSAEPQPTYRPPLASTLEPEPAPAPVPAAREAEGRLPRFLVTEEEQPEPARDPIVPPSRKRPFDALAARLPEAPSGDDKASIGSLMGRLERGLAERAEPETPTAPDPELPPALRSASLDPDAALSSEGVRHRLRSAISDLNQLANRG